MSRAHLALGLAGGVVSGGCSRGCRDRLAGRRVLSPAGLLEEDQEGAIFRAPTIDGEHLQVDLAEASIVLDQDSLVANASAVLDGLQEGGAEPDQKSFCAIFKTFMLGLPGASAR